MCVLGEVRVFVSASTPPLPIHHHHITTTPSLLLRFPWKQRRVTVNQRGAKKSHEVETFLASQAMRCLQEAGNVSVSLMDS